uniref:ABC transporter permease n=1 Tax=Eiseniibacteriota bacterium TaxID=2212470 RepID=A0A832I1I6_UNCEI
MSALLVARNTYREAIRDRMLAGVVGAGLVLLALTQIASPLALGEGTRLTVDLGLSSLTWLGLLVVLLVGGGLVAKEIDRRTIYNLLSRPLARRTYLIGKWAGLSAALWVLCTGLGLALALVLWARGGAGLGPALAAAVILAALELTVITAVAVLFSALSTPVLSALYTLGVFVAGQWSYDLRAFAAKCPPALGAVLEVAANVVPNLPLFNARTLAAEGGAFPALQLALATAYAALYTGCMLALAAAAFESRDFK